MKTPAAEGATYFQSAQAFGKWLEKNHAKKTELLVGFYKTSSGRPSMTWPESVVQALRFGWIDGVGRRVDDARYTIRFTPRKKGSIWSARNLKTMTSLIEEGLVAPAGLAIYEARDAEKTNRYSFEREHVALDEAQEREFRAHPRAWAFFQSQPPSYRKPALWWVVSAKREDTRARRLAQLIADSEAGLRIKQLRRP